MVDKERIERAVAEILQAIGEDPNREGLRETPARVARMYEELTAGYEDNASKHLAKTFAEQGGELVLEKEISFSSTCEHHLMPFFGKVHIAYIPNGKVVGLSKLARVVEVYARRLQLQERMNAEIANAIFKELSPKGVFVVVEAEHTCMTARGIKKVGSKTVTMAKRGEFSDELKNQVLALIK
ncbi:MAG: GTP cyclohydrolase I FolE [Clostridia bacterium]|nr:GTP cyclohydrolase I FolE [Clostridia bacterium]